MNPKVRQLLAAALACLAWAGVVSWLIWKPDAQPIVVDRIGDKSCAVKWSVEGDVEWLCCRSAVLRQVERQGLVSHAHFEVKGCPAWFIGIAAREWLLIGIPARGDTAANKDFAMLRGSTGSLIAAPYHDVWSRFNKALFAASIAARRGDPSFKGKRGLVGIAAVKGRVLAFYSAADTDWCQAQFEGAMPVGDRETIEGLWRCIVSREVIADSVRHAYNVRIHGGGDMQLQWEIFDNR